MAEIKIDGVTNHKEIARLMSRYTHDPLEWLPTKVIANAIGQPVNWTTSTLKNMCLYGLIEKRDTKKNLWRVL